MNYLQVILESFRALNMNRLRTGLTMLGIIIGVGAVTSMLAIGQSVERDINSKIAAMGTNLFMVFPGSQTANGARTGRGGAQTLVQADGQALAEIPGVAYVAPSLQSPSQLMAGSNNWSSTVYGVTPEYFIVKDWEAAQGSVFGDSEVRSNARVAVIGKTVAERLFGSMNPVGQTFRIRNKPFEVMGVLTDEGSDMGGNDQADGVYIPITTARQQLIRTFFPGTVHMLMVQARSTAEMSGLQAEIEQILRARHRIRDAQDDDFTVRDLSALAEAGQDISRMLTILLGGIGSISLLVGGIGIMNIMLVSVTERTREIGIRMALGAKRRDVLMQFLTEAIVICIVGGAMGVGLAWLGAFLITKFSPLAVGITSSGILVALLFSTFIGLFFGFYPASRASSLKPVEALRYE